MRCFTSARWTRTRIRRRVEAAARLPAFAEQGRRGAPPLSLCARSGSECLRPRTPLAPALPFSDAHGMASVDFTQPTDFQRLDGREAVISPRSSRPARRSPRLGNHRPESRLRCGLGTRRPDLRTKPPPASRLDGQPLDVEFVQERQHPAPRETDRNEDLLRRHGRMPRRQRRDGGEHELSVSLVVAGTAVVHRARDIGLRGDDLPPRPPSASPT